MSDSKTPPAPQRGAALAATTPSALCRRVPRAVCRVPCAVCPSALGTLATQNPTCPSARRGASCHHTLGIVSPRAACRVPCARGAALAATTPLPLTVDRHCVAACRVPRAVCRVPCAPPPSVHSLHKTPPAPQRGAALAATTPLPLTVDRHCVAACRVPRAVCRVPCAVCPSALGTLATQNPTCPSARRGASCHHTLCKWSPAAACSGQALCRRVPRAVCRVPCAVCPSALGTLATQRQGVLAYCAAPEHVPL
ncbi:keratin-associated protein 10-12-like [Maniola hyperantus]|uniref:keratin-associated protein 10-12-like n=1 Tax=Aphantopus hyperantus TaxID=2795564 RepID=UPI003749AA30